MKSLFKSDQNVFIYLHLQIYIKARDDSTSMIARKKTQHNRGQLQNANNKDIFSILISFDVQRLQLSECCSMVDGCDTFSRFFQEKIDELLINLHRTTAVDPESGETPCFTASIEVLEPTTVSEIYNILAMHTRSTTY